MFSRWNDSRYRARRTVIQKIAQVRSKMLVTRISRRMAAVETAVPSRFIRSRNSELLPVVLELFLSLSLKHARFLGTLFVYKANVYLLNMVIFPFTLFLYLFFSFFFIVYLIPRLTVFSRLSSNIFASASRRRSTSRSLPSHRKRS